MNDSFIFSNPEILSRIDCSKKIILIDYLEMIMIKVMINREL